MKKILANIAARYQGKKFFTTIGAYALGGYLLSQGHVEAGTALIGIAQGSYNIGQGMADKTEKSEKIEKVIDYMLDSQVTVDAGNGELRATTLGEALASRN